MFSTNILCKYTDRFISRVYVIAQSTSTIAHLRQKRWRRLMLPQLACFLKYSTSSYLLKTCLRNKENRMIWFGLLCLKSILGAVQKWHNKVVLSFERHFGFITWQVSRNAIWIWCSININNALFKNAGMKMRSGNLVWKEYGFEENA